jgi:hypothetical protein
VVLLANSRRLETTVQKDGQLAVMTERGRWACSQGLLGALSQLSGLEGRHFEQLAAAVERPFITELKVLLSSMHLEGELLIRNTAPRDAAYAGRALAGATAR